MKEKVVVRLVQLPQIGFIRDKSRTFRIVIASLKPFQQNISWRLEIDDKIRRRNILDEEIEQSLIDEELVIVEVEIRVDTIFLENVVADRDLRKQVCLASINELPVSVQEIEKLSLKSGAGTIGVEISQEWILMVFAYERCIHASRQALGKRGLSCTNGPIDRYVSKVQVVSQYNAHPTRSPLHRLPPHAPLVASVPVV